MQGLDLQNIRTSIGQWTIKETWAFVQKGKWVVSLADCSLSLSYLSLVSLSRISLSHTHNSTPLCRTNCSAMFGKNKLERIPSTKVGGTNPKKGAETTMVMAHEPNIFSIKKNHARALFTTSTRHCLVKKHLPCCQVFPHSWFRHYYLV